MVYGTRKTTEKYDFHREKGASASERRELSFGERKRSDRDPSQREARSLSWRPVGGATRKRNQWYAQADPPVINWPRPRAFKSRSNKHYLISSNLAGSP